MCFYFASAAQFLFLNGSLSEAASLGKQNKDKTLNEGLQKMKCGQTKKFAGSKYKMRSKANVPTSLVLPTSSGHRYSCRQLTKDPNCQFEM